jgi:hypothetical protein
MTRLEALERLHKTVRAYDENATGIVRWADVRAALDALSALPPATEPVGEVVEVRAAVFRDPMRNIGLTDTTDPRQGAISVRAYESNGWQHIATIRARVPLPSIPEVVGEVEG